MQKYENDLRQTSLFFLKFVSKQSNYHKKLILNFYNIKKKRTFTSRYTKIDFLKLITKKRFTLKTKLLKYIFSASVVLFVVACSTKKNTFLARNNHALSTKYNILYNGGIALNKGIEELKTQYNDNFWEQLPIERMQVVQTKATIPGQEKKNANFERAEDKAIKAIQKHSMNIQGSEKNPQMDEAHLMLGKARYYDQRFVPALEAFNYILYKYPSSDKIYEAKIWREKTNMRLDNDAIAVTNLTKLLKEIKFKDQIFADANAALAQAFLNLEQKDSAMLKLQVARDFTKKKEEKSRYYFILGQLFESLNLKDSAFASYQSVIDMNRNAARQYVIQAHARQAAQFEVAPGDSIIFLKKFKDLLEDRENRPFLDVLNHQMALYYEKNKNFKRAKDFYNISLKKRGNDQYLAASNYRNLADIYFNEAKYVTAGKYYDSTLVQLNDRTREFKFIKKKRLNLDDVIKYEGIATRNDSILKIVAMSDSGRKSFYEDYISKLKKEEEVIKKLESENAILTQNNPKSSNSENSDEAVEMMEKMTQKTRAVQDEKVPVSKVPAANNSIGKTGSFYFYNQQTLEFGKLEFKKLWGNRALKDNWRTTSAKSNTTDFTADEEEKDFAENKNKKEEVDPRFSSEFYISQLPKTQKENDSISKERNFAYYQLGLIYKEKFKEYKLAASKLENLLQSNPEERLVLASMYHLYKIYELIDKEKALAMKDKIISQYPTSRYAQILSKSDSESELAVASPETTYDNLYKEYLKGDYKKVLSETTEAIDQYSGEDIVSKYELLKSNVTGKLKGIEEFKKSLNYVALNYPNSEEGKTAEAFLGKEIPQMEALEFYAIAPKSWKILYKAKDSTETNTMALNKILTKFIEERSIGKLTLSNDIYTMEDNFLVIHGISTEESAKGIATILKEFKDYKVKNTPYIISNENYKIVQIKKNFETYLTTPYSDPKPLAATPVPPLRPVAPKEEKKPVIEETKQNNRNQPPSLSEDDPQEKPRNDKGQTPTLQPTLQNSNTNKRDK